MADNDHSGFCIAYAVRNTPDKGQGVFAGAAVSKGSIIYRNLRGQFKVYDEASLRKLLAPLSQHDASYELTHMFGLADFAGFVIRFYDDGVLINHSSEPNIAMNFSSDENGMSSNSPGKNVTDVEDALLNVRYGLIAIQDLKVGDELTMDYDGFTEDPLYYDELCVQYGVLESYLDWDE